MESARLGGITEGKKATGNYTAEDSRFFRHCHETIAENRKKLRVLAAQAAEPVGRLTIEHFRGVREMENVDFEYTGQLEPGTYRVYTTPPPQPKSEVPRG